MNPHIIKEGGVDMSYGFITPCYNCKKNDKCEDAKNIQEGISNCYKNNETHKGSGNVMLCCAKCEAKAE